ncbi:MAG: hypothetical protein K2X27_22735 [Candidatus Obscuribacterales bacterium]|nr:hypothetical protein [Candidatus Obscuribacterales bacterium]
MPEFLDNLMIAGALGAFLGIVYGRGACLTLDLDKFSKWLGLSFALASLLMAYLSWTQFSMSSATGAGICLVFYLRVKCLRYCLPYQLKKASLAARPGEEEPGVGFIDGYWTLCYRNGMALSYDYRGRLRRVLFPDASIWELLDEPKATIGTDESWRWM